MDTSGKVVAGSAPAIYPVGGPLDVPPPGRERGLTRTRTGLASWHFSPAPVKTPAGGTGFGTLGHVYVQAPSDAAPPAPGAGELWPLVVAGGLALGLVCRSGWCSGC